MVQQAMETMKLDDDKPKSFVRRDHLLEIETEVQERWAKAKLFESDAASPTDTKYMATFPYPYMNGFMHIGHGFTRSQKLCCFIITFVRCQPSAFKDQSGYFCGMTRARQGNSGVC